MGVGLEGRTGMGEESLLNTSVCPVLQGSGWGREDPSHQCSPRSVPGREGPAF